MYLSSAFSGLNLEQHIAGEPAPSAVFAKVSHFGADINCLKALFIVMSLSRGEQGTGNGVSRIPWSEPLFSPEPSATPPPGPQAVSRHAAAVDSKGTRKWRSKLPGAVPGALDLAAGASHWFH